jgi:hypothetical protein
MNTYHIAKSRWLQVSLVRKLILERVLHLSLSEQLATATILPDIVNAQKSKKDA